MVEAVIMDEVDVVYSDHIAVSAAGTHGWLPHKTGWLGLRRGGVGRYNLHSPPDCGTPTTSRLYPFGAGGVLITLIRDNITFTTTDIPSTINTHNTELQMVKVHINNTINISQLQKCIYLLETAHPRTTKH